MVNNSPYTIQFSSVLKPVVSSEKDNYLALASLEQLRTFIPKIDEKNVDLLAFSTDAYVVNHVNLNGAVVDSETAVDTIDMFIYKQCNLEHDRNKVVGVLLTAAFSEFETNKPISKDDARKMKSPYNVTVGGVIWRVVNDKLADYLEDTNDPNSPNYQKVSASYEMGYDEFDIALLPSDSRNLEDAEIITSGEEKAKFSKLLKNFGGNGKTEDGKNVAIILKGNVTPLGIGLTESPAAAVKGLAVPEDTEKEEDASIMKTEEILNKLNNLDKVFITNSKELTESLRKVGEIANETKANFEKLQEKISHLENSNVKKNNVIMKITSLKDITDEALAAKTITASSIDTFVQDELKKANDQWTKEKEEKDNLIKTNTEKAAELEKINKQLQEDLDKVKAGLQKLEEEKAAREKQEKFNARMAAFDTKYELTDDDRAAIASQVKDVSDEDFSKVEKNLTVLLKSKDKEAIAAAKKTEQTASLNKNETEVVEQTVEGATQTTSTPPATTAPAAKSLKEKFANHFKPENIKVEIYKGR